MNKNLFDKISELTFNKTINIGLENAKLNKKYIKNTIKNLKNKITQKNVALIISAGPSLHLKNSINTIKNIGFDGYIISVDGALGHCLRNKLIPDFVVTVDPDRKRIVRWFGDHEIKKNLEDDYFRRQDLDPELNNDEIKKK